eukprot:224320_1
MSRIRFLHQPSIIFKHYSRLLEERPISTKVATNIFIMSFADVLQQYIEFRTLSNQLLNDNNNTIATRTHGKILFWKHHYDKIRTLRMCTFMALFQVPYLHFWHKFLDVRILKIGIKQPAAAVITKVSIDQFIATPPYIIWFLFATSCLEGLTMDKVGKRIETNWKPMMLTCWKLWIPAHCVTFSLPFKYRSLFCDCIRIYWGTLMSYYSNRNNE